MKQDVSQIGLALCQTAFGWVGMATSENRLCRLILPTETEDKAEAELRKGYPEGKQLPKEELAELKDKLKRYFAGEPVDFGTVVLDLSSGSGFQRATWAACKAIPRGEVRTYKWVAQAVGSPRAGRAVGQALAANPIPIIIPCHRVVGTNGSLIGFGGGLDMKRRLLQLEKRNHWTTLAKRS